MANELFKSPKLKIERAKKHISELQSEIVAFLEREPYRIVVEQDSEPGRQSWVIRVREEVPSHIPTIIGDAIHNLRAALDLLACDLVRMNGGDVDEVYFPFCKEGEALERTIKQRHIDRASPDIIDIVRSLKPYHRGNEALRAIHDFDITDKHKLLIPCMFYTGIPNFVLRTNSMVMMMLNNRVGPIKDGQGIVSGLPATPQFKIGDYFKPSIDVTFNERPFNGHPVVPTLHQLTELVNGIIQTFEAHCRGSNT